MSDEKKKSLTQAIINAVIAILTALFASSCTCLALGTTPFRMVSGFVG